MVAEMKIPEGFALEIVSEPRTERMNQAAIAAMIKSCDENGHSAEFFVMVGAKMEALQTELNHKKDSAKPSAAPAYAPLVPAFA